MELEHNSSQSPNNSNTFNYKSVRLFCQTCRIVTSRIKTNPNETFKCENCSSKFLELINNNNSTNEEAAGSENTIQPSQNSFHFTSSRFYCNPCKATFSRIITNPNQTVRCQLCNQNCILLPRSQSNNSNSSNTSSARPHNHSNQNSPRSPPNMNAHSHSHSNTHSHSSQMPTTNIFNFFFINNPAPQSEMHEEMGPFGNHNSPFDGIFNSFLFGNPFNHFVFQGANEGANAPRGAE